MLRLLTCLALALSLGSSFAQDVPRSAVPYRAQLTRIAHSEWGLDAPVATFAAQLQQESGWNPQAVSKVGAVGMAQFMPATARWWCSKQGWGLLECTPRNPVWAMRALVQYDLWLSNQIQSINPCQRMAFALSAYNGGLGWVFRDQKKAGGLGKDFLTWFDSVERVNAGRSAANFKENRDYPQRILMLYEPRYVVAGWGVGACHDK
ncbi:MAG: transglycosylase SLT domain-containing protein [Undibacterium sp.]|nr:transglycosylase SLT domain-containing protein [Undibacterium sp.]